MRKGVDCNGREWEEKELSKNIEDISGKEYEHFRVLFPVMCDGRMQWLCLCECGNEFVTRSTYINKEKVKSCGCWKANRHNLNHFDLIGKRFDRLVVLEYIGLRLMPDNITKRATYKCICDCGNEVLVSKVCLTSGHTKSCGCIQSDVMQERWSNFREENDIIGMKFGKLTVVKFNGIKNEGSMYECNCDCGNTIICLRNNLVNGYSQSCGCTSSIGELHTIKILNDNNISYKSQYTFPDLLSPKGYHLRYDFGIIDKCVLIRLVEFDGLQHNNPSGFLTEEEFIILQKYDAIKNQYALSHNIPLVRIPYSKRDTMCLEDILGNKYLIKGDN